MAGACSTHRGDEKWVQNFSFGFLKGEAHSEDLGVDVRAVLKSISGKCGSKMWTRFIWLMRGTNREML
jgi:hypothetical protein